jgi:hypothetical protein
MRIRDRKLPTIGKHNLLLIPSICLIVVSLFSLSLAVYYPFQNKNTIINETLAPLKSETGQVEFFIPNAQPFNTTATTSTAVEVFCTVNSTSFVQGEPSLITFKLLFEKIVSNLYVDTMQVYPLNAIDLYNASYSNKTGITYIPTQVPIMSVLNPIPSTEDSIWQTWEAGGGVIFQNSGPINLEIRVYVQPNQNILSSVNMTGFKSEYDMTFTIPDIYIISGQTSQQMNTQQQQEIQQQNNENNILSLTFFVLFFASLDIAVVFYDHSKDKDKEAEYNAIEEEKKRNEIAKHGQQTV